jgi:hypothetical protein
MNIRTQIAASKYIISDAKSFLDKLYKYIIAINIVAKIK